MQAEEATAERSGPASLAIVGSYPPPYGGVGIHVQRLCPLLEARGLRYVVYNATSEVGDGQRIVPVYRQRRTWVLRYLLTAREPAVYLMSGRLIAWVVGGLLASWRGKRVLLRLRNASLPDWVRESPWRRFWAGFALRRMSGVVCVSRLLMDSARALGVPAERLHWSPGFLPPGVGPADRQEVAPEVWRFIERRRPVITANGKVDWYEGQDLYGLDHLVELAGRLKPDYPDVGVIVCFSDHSAAEQAYVDRLQQRAAELGVAENILFNTRSGVFVPVLAAGDVFVRPTNTDGDAISVREALYLGVPTVASDAVTRPEGAMLFRARDLDGFERCVREALALGQGAGGRRAGGLTAEDEARIRKYVDLLCAVAGGPARCTAPANGA
jgi:glycosyltransferase involved in cell wall biosynthesis